MRIRRVVPYAAPRTRGYNGVLSSGTFNCSSITARSTRAKHLHELSRAPHIDWARLLEEFSVRVLDATRTGGEAVDLRALERPREQNAITVALYNRKSNLTSLIAAAGFRISFGPGRTLVQRTDLAQVDDLAAGLPIWQRIRSAVQHQPQTPEALAEALGVKQSSIDRIVRTRSTCSRACTLPVARRGLRW